MLLKVRVIPNSREVRVTTTADDAIEVRVDQPAVDGRANKRLLEILSDYYKTPKFNITIVRGARSRDKIVNIAPKPNSTLGAISQAPPRFMYKASRISITRGPEMKKRWFLFVLLALTASLVLVLLVPVVLDPSFAHGGTSMVCSPRGCISFVQYDSISYAYGGWGAYFQTGVNYYTVSGWFCSCPAESPGHYIPCCVPPYAGTVWPIVYSLIAGVIATTTLLIWNPWPQNRPAKL